MKAELQAAASMMHAASQRLTMDARDAQPRRVGRYACSWRKRVRSAAVVCFLERHFDKMEKKFEHERPVGILPNH